MIMLMTVDPERLRIAMRQWATGVTVVCASDGIDSHGMTVSSFTSVSLDPPLVLISLEQSTLTRQLVNKSGFFGVTILNSDQELISDRFAGRTGVDVDRLKGLDTYTLQSGSPLLTAGLAALDCQVVRDIPVGTHVVVIGKVLDVFCSTADNPLLYYDQEYRFLNWNEQSKE